MGNTVAFNGPNLAGLAVSRQLASALGEVVTGISLLCSFFMLVIKPMMTRPLDNFIQSNLLNTSYEDLIISYVQHHRTHFNSLVSFNILIQYNNWCDMHTNHL